MKILVIEPTLINHGDDRGGQSAGIDPRRFRPRCRPHFCPHPPASQIAAPDHSFMLNQALSSKQAAIPLRECVNMRKPPGRGGFALDTTDETVRASWSGRR